MIERLSELEGGVTYSIHRTYPDGRHLTGTVVRTVVRTVVETRNGRDATPMYQRWIVT